MFDRQQQISMHRHAGCGKRRNAKQRTSGHSDHEEGTKVPGYRSSGVPREDALIDTFVALYV